MIFTSKNINSFTSYRIPVGTRISEYFINEHNVNMIDLPKMRSGPVTGITITSVPVLFKDDDGKEYIAKTINEETNGFIPHFYVCLRANWQLLEFSRCWQKQKTNRTERTTISIAVTCNDGIGTPMMFNMVPFQESAKLAAYILYKNNLKPKDIKVTKNCAEFITSRWKEFKWMVTDKFTKLGGKV